MEAAVHRASGADAVVSGAKLSERVRQTRPPWELLIQADRVCLAGVWAQIEVQYNWGREDSYWCSQHWLRADAERAVKRNANLRIQGTRRTAEFMLSLALRVPGKNSHTYLLLREGAFGIGYRWSPFPDFEVKELLALAKNGDPTRALRTWVAESSIRDLRVTELPPEHRLPRSIAQWLYRSKRRRVSSGWPMGILRSWVRTDEP